VPLEPFCGQSSPQPPLQRQDRRFFEAGCHPLVTKLGWNCYVLVTRPVDSRLATPRMLFAEGGSNTLMIDSVDLEALNDGTCRIWCRTVEKLAILTSLHWGRMEVLEQDDAVSSQTPPSRKGSGTGDKVSSATSCIIVRGSYSNASFALANMVKTIRPSQP
jgi:hypothetical protein